MIKILNENVTVTSNYGRIDVIWLDGISNTKSYMPNTPNLTNNMTYDYNRQGVLCSGYSTGPSVATHSFRVILCPK